jgi:hypothetical protein
MRARRAARAEARRLAAVEVAFTRAAGLVGPAERRRRARATKPVDQPASTTIGQTGCESMTHNSVGSERFCANEDPLHLDDHDDGCGDTWPVESWER